ncbi:uncharacterized protein A4U43_C06F4000 [Asparagus officinalis]|uniref:Peptidase S8/S53 domain-containing protein n=1 Tax=Asparagus officinalis TaxID=4686 RepID=A0A5P1EJE6_ASPOF|nr:uncharacterized protein A4U43_C06F4000 [Asparagus officinalis]
MGLAAEGKGLLAGAAGISSRGPNYHTPEIVKPDVTTPGIKIHRSMDSLVSPSELNFDPSRTEFNISSQTSISCPHESSIAALLRQRLPDWSPAAIKSTITTTANNIDNSGKPSQDLASMSTPFDIGAGHINTN